MLSFSAIDIEDKPSIDPIMQQDGTISSIRTFVSLYIWGDHYKTCICHKEGILFFKACYADDILTYYMPLGGSLERALELIEQDAKMHGMEYEIARLTQGARDKIERLFPEKYALEEMRADFEYVYKSEDLRTLRGKKYHGKRNFINRFLAEYSGRWEYSPIDPVRDYDEIIDFVRLWGKDKESEANNDFHYEYSAIKRALRHYNKLDIRGGIIRIDGKIIAFTFGTPQNARAMDIMIEKADATIEGAYQMINQQFAIHECESYELINREEDMGIDGLRQAKLSYHPAFLTAKYKAVPRK